MMSLIERLKKNSDENAENDGAKMIQEAASLITFKICEELGRIANSSFSEYSYSQKLNTGYYGATNVRILLDVVRRLKEDGFEVNYDLVGSYIEISWKNYKQPLESKN
jgi:hypothetical protein